MKTKKKIKHCWKCGNEVPYIKYEDVKEIPKCECCGALYPEKPKDEALLMIYQDAYLADRSDENFNRFFSLLEVVTFNIIKHKLKSNSSYESMDDMRDNVQWSLSKLVEYYKEKPDFKITTSFITYISQVVLYPLYNPDEKERKQKEISIYSSKFGNSDKGNNDKELCDYLSQDYDGGLNKIEFDLDYDTDKNNIVYKSIEFIKTVMQSIYDYENSNKSFRQSLYMLILYKFFISGDSNDVLVKKIVNSLDYSLVKKFEESKDLYKQMLMEYA